MPTPAQPNGRVTRRRHALATLTRQQLRARTVRAEWERDALIALLAKERGRAVTLPASRFFFPTAAELDLHLEIEVDDETAAVTFRAVEGPEGDDGPVEASEPDHAGTDAPAGQG
jgi:hypothetical protein